MGVTHEVCFVRRAGWRGRVRHMLDTEGDPDGAVHL